MKIANEIKQEDEFTIPEDMGWDEFDSIVEELDFSGVDGSFRKKFKNVGSNIRKKKRGGTKEFGIQKRGKIVGGKKQISKVIVPRDRKVIVEGVSKFILSDDSGNTAIKRIGYHDGKKLKALVLLFNNNDSAVDFPIDIFDPSAPLDYLYNTSQNLNDKIQIAGGNVAYSDVLFNQLANPMNVYNAKFTFSGTNMVSQMAIPLEFHNKSAEGKVKVQPLSIDLKIDSMQVANDIAFFDIQPSLNRAYVPDGMDIIRYTVLAGMTVTMAFFYDQVSLKKEFWADAAKSKGLM